VLQRKTLIPERIVDARKEALAAEEAWKLLAGVREILIAKGKNYQVFDPQKDSREAILAQALGRTGNLRAPALLIDNRLLVGFSDGLYSQFLG
jgi:arsenate reductase-like glutaredoxin family protein